MDTNTTSPQIPIETDLPDERELKRAIEAILFAAGHPVSYTKLADVLGVTPAYLKRTVEDYAAEYNCADSPLPRGVMLLTFADSCQLCTMEQYGTEIREALGIRRGGNLSTASIEVLAIVAYNEPVTRAYIDTVRGVDSSYGVNALCEKHLIEPCGRLDAPGRPLLYRTTPDFLRVFGMQSLDDLPVIDLPARAAGSGILQTDDTADSDPSTKEDNNTETEK